MSGTGDIEKRSWVAEIRTAGRRAEGYVATFGAVADLGGGLTETIKRGAFSDTLRNNGDVLALLDHDMRSVLGRTRSGTLKLMEDDKGLAFSLELPATRAGDDVLALASRNDLGGMSFGFLTPRGGDTWEGNRRTLNKIDLREISIVSSLPAYPDTSIAVRHLQHVASQERRRLIVLAAEMDRWA